MHSVLCCPFQSVPGLFAVLLVRSVPFSFRRTEIVSKRTQQLHDDDGYSASFSSVAFCLHSIVCACCSPFAIRRLLRTGIFELKLPLLL